MKTTSILAMTILATLTASAASAQSSETVQTPEAAAAPAPAASARQDWNAVSRSATRVYLVDVSSIKANGDVTAVDLARVPLNPASPTARNYTQVAMEFRCSAKQSRAFSETDHDEAGAALDPVETGETFSPYEANTLDAYVAAVVCEGARAEPPTYPSIAAFIDAGRPSPRR